MASPTLAELAKRVEHLEADNARLAALSKPGAGGVELGVDREHPTRDAYEVRSELTGAVVGRHDTPGDANTECDRLNAECRRDGIKHQGEPMRYEVVKVRVTDDDTVRTMRTAELKTQIDAAEDKTHRAELVAELEAFEASYGE